VDWIHVSHDMGQCCWLLVHSDHPLGSIKGGGFVEWLEILTSVLLKTRELR